MNDNYYNTGWEETGKCGGYAYFESYVSGGITTTPEEGPKAENNKASEKRHTTNIGRINNFFKVNN